MTTDSADGRSMGGARPNDVRPSLDAVDRRLVSLLAADARLPNNALAQRAGIAPSTCLSRVRALRERGVIRGFHADVDPAALGRSLQAMIAVRLQATARSHITAFMARIADAPAVLNVFFLGGADDFFVHIAAADTAGLREFVVEHLNADPDVAATETNVIFDHARGSLSYR